MSRPSPVLLKATNLRIMACTNSHSICERCPSRGGPLRAALDTCRRPVFCAAKHAGNRKGGRANGAQADNIEKQKQLLSALVPATNDRGDAESISRDDAEEDMGVTLVKKGKRNAKVQPSFEQLQGSLYSHPRIYDWAFGYRDYEEEVSCEPTSLMLWLLPVMLPPQRCAHGT